ncbi:hypothetical protein B0H21DRAFT_195704 [Amylocystis lapponica]|nr:hypothetical protein B0H21DRAFT_195704 [Amylocystis lapponica]
MLMHLQRTTSAQPKWPLLSLASGTIRHGLGLHPATLTAALPHLAKINRGEPCRVLNYSTPPCYVPRCYCTGIPSKTLRLNRQVTTMSSTDLRTVRATSMSLPGKFLITGAPATLVRCYRMRHYVVFPNGISEQIGIPIGLARLGRPAAYTVGLTPVWSTSHATPKVLCPGVATSVWLVTVRWRTGQHPCCARCTRPYMRVRVRVGEGLV